MRVEVTRTSSARSFHHAGVWAREGPSQGSKVLLHYCHLRRPRDCLLCAEQLHWLGACRCGEAAGVAGASAACDEWWSLSTAGEGPARVPHWPCIGAAIPAPGRGRCSAAVPAAKDWCYLWFTRKDPRAQGGDGWGMSLQSQWWLWF